LDLDDTLYSYDECHQSGMNGFKNFCQTNFNISDKEASECYAKARKIINERLLGQAASHSRLLYAKEFCELLKLDPVKYALELEDSYWNSFFDSLTLREHALQFLESLKSAGKKIVLLTDLTTEIQLKKLDYLKIGFLFDVIVTSEEAGIEKPSAKIFQLALLKSQAIKSETVMIGDNFQKDVLGARNFGIDAYLFGQKENEQFCIHTFNEAIEIFI
jgi:putative hydrolase of the HAD superfamily